MTVTLTAEQQRAFAEALGLDPWTMTYERAAARIDEMQRQAAARSFDDDADPTGILKITPMPAERPVVAPTTNQAGDPVIDAAIGAGKIEPSERPTWRRHFEEEPDLTREILDDLPGNADRTTKAFQEDRRLRSLGDQLDDLLGIAKEDRVVRNYDDDSLSDSEQLYQRLADLTNAPDARR